MMYVRVDAEKCQGHNRCFVVAAELFELDDYGYSHEVGDGVVPPELEEKARLAVANCPESAISTTGAVANNKQTDRRLPRESPP